jgi:DNA-binding NarL/FixJ family response regulator
MLPHAIRECLAGRSFTSPRAAQGLAERGAAEPLSLQEQKVYDLVREGFSVQAIAERLDVSRSTVVTYFGRIVTNLDAFVKASERCLYEGAKRVRITRA